MTDVIKLAPYDALRGRQRTRDTYRDYTVWRGSPAYRRWLKRQWARQEGRCFYCQQSLVGRSHNVEHVMPMSRGGGNEGRNLVLACPMCNKSKGSSRPRRKTLKRSNALNHPWRSHR